MTTDHPTTPKQKLRWYQYSLRTLLIFVTVFAVLCSIYAVVRNSAERQKKAVEVLDKFGCELWYESQWKRWMAMEKSPGFPGNDYFDSVAYVSIYDKKITNQVLKAIRDLKHLKILKLYHSSITDADLDYFEDLYLDELWLSNNQITDEGLKHLEGLNHLHYLNLEQTLVTDAGISKLKKALPNCVIQH